MSYIVNLTIRGRAAVVVGSGDLAAQKARDLREAGAEVRTIDLDAYSAGYLQGAFLVIAATEDEESDARISQDAQTLGVLVNVVDRPALCTFTLPALVRRGDLTLAISTEGQCPALASVLREELAAKFGPDWAERLRAFAELRREMMARGANGAEIRAAIRRLYASQT